MGSADGTLHKCTLHNKNETLQNRELYKHMHVHTTLDHLSHLYNCTSYGYRFFKQWLGHHWPSLYTVL